MTDQPTTTRPGEELNIPRLQAYLLDNLPKAKGSLEVLQFPSGFSNLTYLLRLGDRELVLRRPPFGANIKTAHDMAREYRILSSLKPVYPKVPQPLLYCADERILGAPFYLMERLYGVILRTQPPPGLTPQRMRGVCEAAVEALVELHHLDYQKAGLGDLGRPEGYVERQVRGWTERYQKARTEEIPGMEQAMEWLAAHIPTSSSAALIHNDFKYDNLMLNPANLTQVIAVLDWEMATLGDPLMDLGTTLGYWAEPDDPPGLRRFGLTHLPGNLSRAELVEAYVARSGRSVANIVFYYVYGLFKVGVIMQQIYARYQKGYTRDERFAMLIHLIREIAQKIQKAIYTGEI